jgi:hypothetical protein
VQPAAGLDVKRLVKRLVADPHGPITREIDGRSGPGSTLAPTTCSSSADLHIRVINAATGELLRDLTLDPAKDYQPTGRQPGTPRKRKGPEP